MSSSRPENRRRYERFVLAPMYTSVRAHRAGHAPVLDGHAYDISEGGVRIELDEPLAHGESIDLAVRLPGESADVAATASVVRAASRRTDPGPLQVALRFDRFASEDDRRRLVGFFGGRSGVHAA